MNKKGFTLVELLAVMTILLAISVVAVINVSASLKRSEEKESESQEKLAINAAKIYFSNNNKMIETSSVEISVLINEGYIEKEKISKLDESYYVVYCSNRVGYGINSSTNRYCS